MSKTVLILFAACVGLSLLSLHLVKQMRAGQATIAELQEQVAKLERASGSRPRTDASSAGPHRRGKPSRSRPRLRRHKEPPKAVHVVQRRVGSAR